MRCAHSGGVLWPHDGWHGDGQAGLGFVHASACAKPEWWLYEREATLPAAHRCAPPLPAGHSFCGACLEHHIDRNKKTQCPICRKRIESRVGAGRQGGAGSARWKQGLGVGRRRAASVADVMRRLNDVPR